MLFLHYAKNELYSIYIKHFSLNLIKDSIYYEYLMHKTYKLLLLLLLGLLNDDNLLLRLLYLR